MLLDHSELVVYCVSKIDLTVRTVVASPNFGQPGSKLIIDDFSIVYIEIVV